jgi:intraflagellar transport protein 172
MCFSPDNQKLAIAQSDNIVFIYKLGIDWGEKKSICNKFNQNSSVTCMSWPLERPNELIIGLAEGKIKQGILKTNKS